MARPFPMMRLYDTYPEQIELDGKTVRLDLSYSNVLRVLDLQEETALLPEDRLALQCELLLADGEKVPRSFEKQAELLLAVFDLFPKGEEAPKERYIDFKQDAGMIRSAFFRIGVDLTRDNIHFMQFLELLSDLPSDTALMRAVNIRQQPIPQITEHNKEQVARLLEAKRRYEIKITDEERRARFAGALKNTGILKG
jgi:hypothetical protein